MKKEVVTIRLDFLQGPIWISDVDTGQPMTGIDVIDNDEVVTSINHEISLLYSSFYEFDSNGEPCTFNSQKEKENKNKLLELLSKLLDRLNEINDSSYEINDEETARISSL